MSNRGLLRGSVRTKQQLFVSSTRAALISQLYSASNKYHASQHNVTALFGFPLSNSRSLQILIAKLQLDRNLKIVRRNFGKLKLNFYFIKFNDQFFGNSFVPWKAAYDKAVMPVLSSELTSALL